MSFDEKVVIVTGAARGIARASAKIFGAQGAHVVVADLNRDGGQETVDEIQGEGGQAVYSYVDLKSLESIQGLVDGVIDRHSRIDVLANVAAIWPSGSFLETTSQIFDDIIAVDLKAVYFLSQAVARTMVPRRSGTIVMVASGSAFRATLDHSAYNAAKGGVISMMRTIALEMAPHHIRVNAVAPGHTASDTIRANFSEEALAMSGANLLPGRWMEPREVAEAIVFLAGDDSSGMHGAVINVNGGDFMPH